MDWWVTIMVQIWNDYQWLDRMVRIWNDYEWLDRNLRVTKTTSLIFMAAIYHYVRS